jgi:peptidoglycan hydrolase CwlO-like protein
MYRMDKITNLNDKILSLTNQIDKLNHAFQILRGKMENKEDYKYLENTIVFIRYDLKSIKNILREHGFL